MALHHGTSLAAKLGNLNAEWPNLYTRDNHDSFPQLVARNGTTASNNTLNMFIDSVGDGFEYAASVVTACADQTILAIRCTDGPATITVGGVKGDPGCGLNAVPVTVTVGPSLYAGSTVTSTKSAGHTAALTGAEKCALSGTTKAVCTATALVVVDGTSTVTATSATETLTASDYHRYDVAITAGAEKTVSPAATCASNGASGLNTKMVAIWALTGVTGVVAFLAAL